MAPNPLRPVARHEPNHEAAGYRDQNCEPAEMVPSGRNERRAHPAVVEQIREKRDEAKQRPSYKRAENANADREQRNWNHSHRCGKITQRLRVVTMMVVQDADFLLP